MAYIGAAFALCLALSPLMSSVAGITNAGAAARTVDGIASAIGGLKSGMSAKFSYDSSSSQWSVTLGSHSVSASYGGTTFVRSVSCQLPTMTLESRVTYTVVLQGDSARVSQGG